jgi:hypothetical protein
VKNVWNKLLEFFFKLYLNREVMKMIRALAPGGETILPSGSITDRGIRYEFQIHVWRHNPQ